MLTIARVGASAYVRINRGRSVTTRVVPDVSALSATGSHGGPVTVNPEAAGSSPVTPVPEGPVARGFRRSRDRMRGGRSRADDPRGTWLAGASPISPQAPAGRMTAAGRRAV